MPVSAAAEAIDTWRSDPTRFVRDVFAGYWSESGEQIQAWQDEALLSVRDNQRTALQACKGPGKTTVEAWANWWFLFVHQNAKAAATSVTGSNLRDNLWAELALWRSRSPLIQRAFEWTAERIFNREYPESWFLSARTWSRDADRDQQAQTLAGLHADYLLFTLDEAGGIPDAVARAMKGGLSTGKVTRALIAGNPTHLEGYVLYQACVEHRPAWNVIEITGDPDDPKRSPRVSEQWAREMIHDYGRESSIVQVDVLGRFPSAATDALVSRQSFEDAFDRYFARDVMATTPRTLGLDVARYGPDRNVLIYRAGDAVERAEEWRGQDTVYTAGRTQEAAREWKAEMVYVDDVGVGGGVTDQLANNGLPVTGINVGSSPRDPTKHINLRSELNLAIQDRFRKGMITINPELRETTTLLAEGTTLRSGYSTGSRRKIEAKDEYKRRTGRSPDYWDALVLAYADTGFSEWVF